jgi:cytochrome c-type biogenesis protein CcmH
VKRAGTAVLLGAVVVAAATLLFVAIRGPQPPRTLQDRVRSVASTLRCPVCQDLSVADSPSSVARQMRATIASDLRAGRTPAEVTARFVRAYGPWILLAPPRQGIDLIAWIGPALLVVGALVLAVVAVRRWTFGSERPGVLDAPTSPTGVPVAVAGGNGIGPQDRRLLDRALAAIDDDAD